MATTAVRIPRARGRNVPLSLVGGVGYLLLLGLALLWLAPLAWIALTAVKAEPEIIRLPIQWWPTHPTAENFGVALTTTRTANIGRAFFNSTFVATAETIVTLAIDAMAGYALARLRFRGRALVFGVIVASLMVPVQITLVPLYLMLEGAGWLNTYQALVLPGLSRAFGVFLMRQFFLALPHDLQDAARIDGAGPFTTFIRVALPLVKPALAALGIFTFLRSWNDFTWPLIAISSNEMMTLPVALARLLGSFRVEYGIVMAGATASALPLIIVFFLAQRQIIQGVALTGMKD
ncbi:MAG TPA: carbohydrate ABC transporter permease [bacterium]|nr:carbohydrate ABC transporter permease [bacterium]